MSVHTDSLEEVCDECVIEDQHHMKAANKNKKKKHFQETQKLHKQNKSFGKLMPFHLFKWLAMSYRNR